MHKVPGGRHSVGRLLRLPAEGSLGQGPWLGARSPAEAFDRPPPADPGTRKQQRTPPGTRGSQPPRTDLPFPCQFDRPSTLYHRFINYPHCTHSGTTYLSDRCPEPDVHYTPGPKPGAPLNTRLFSQSRLILRHPHPHPLDMRFTAVTVLLGLSLAADVASAQVHRMGEAHHQLARRDGHLEFASGAGPEPRSVQIPISLNSVERLRPTGQVQCLTHRSFSCEWPCRC